VDSQGSPKFASCLYDLEWSVRGNKYTTQELDGGGGPVTLKCEFAEVGEMVFGCVPSRDPWEVRDVSVLERDAQEHLVDEAGTRRFIIAGAVLLVVGVPATVCMTVLMVHFW